MLARSLLTIAPVSLALLTGPGARAAWAHGVDAGRMSLDLEEGVVRLVVTPPSRAFAWADDDHDGQLALGEVAAHRDALRTEVDRGLVLRDGEGRAPTCGVTDVSTPGSGRSGVVPPSDHLRVARVCRFATAPPGLTVGTTSAWGPLTVEAVRLARDAGGATVAASQVERALLPDAPATVTLWSRPPPRPAPPRPAPPWRLLALASLVAGWLALRSRLPRLSPLASRSQTPCR